MFQDLRAELRSATVLVGAHTLCTDRETDVDAAGRDLVCNCLDREEARRAESARD